MDTTDYTAVIVISLILALMVGLGIILGWFIFGRKETCPEKTQEENEENEKQVWATYCQNLEEWFQANQHIFLPSDLTSKQLQIIYAMAGLKYENRLQFWKILMIWGCEESGHARLRFDVEWEILEKKT